MYIAVINKETNLVENVVVPPTGSNIWFLADTHQGVTTDYAAIGDSYIDGEFVKPPSE